MPGFSRKTMPALEAVLDVACNARPGPVQSRDISQRQGVPQRHLEQIMQRLVRAGLLKGVRGPKGGYILARERRKITVADVVRAVDRSEEETDAEMGENPSPSRGLGELVIAPLMTQVRDSLLAEFEKITIEDLCRKAHSHGLAQDAETGTKTGSDFTI